MLALLAHAKGEHQRMGEDALQCGVALDLAHDVARDAAEIGADRLQSPVGALELLGVGVALVGDQRMFADPLIPPGETDAGFPGQPHQPLARPMHELGVGRKGDRLRLNRGIHNDLGEVGGLAAPVRVATARLSWISATSFSSPIRWRQRVSDERSKVSLCRKNSSPQNS